MLGGSNGGSGRMKMGGKLPTFTGCFMSL